jgi:diguanylate cyclase (GGDEF)-like protein
MILGCLSVLVGIAAVAMPAAPKAALAWLVAAQRPPDVAGLLFCCGLLAIGWCVVAVQQPATPRRAANTGSIDPDLPANLAPRAHLAAQLAHQAGGPHNTAILVVDVDGFRRLVRTHGSDGADALLRHLGDRLLACAPPGALVAHQTADEFVVLLPPGDAAAACMAAAHLISSMRPAFMLEGLSINLAVSIGVAMGPADGATVNELLRAARLAVSLAKADGGQDWRMYDAGLCRAAQERAVLGADVAPGLQAGQFVPYYQPIVSLNGGQIVGMEVLARWHHPERGLLAPDDFIHLMEEQHLCNQLSLSLLRQVIADAGAWPPAWTFAFNASAGQLGDMLNFITDIGKLADGGMDPRRIELEVTETVLIKDMRLARQMVQTVHRTGAKVALDDFGTGYANLLPLRDLPFDRIKIDRGFVRDMLVSARADACMRAMLFLARSLGASVIAEGVESEATENRLRDMGCEFAQGYYYSKPVPAEGVALLARRVELRAQSRAVAA